MYSYPLEVLSIKHYYHLKNTTNKLAESITKNLLWFQYHLQLNFPFHSKQLQLHYYFKPLR